jgi:hypothetical protein
VSRQTVGDESRDGDLEVTGTLTAGAVAEFADGSAGAPSITNTGDENTGVFFPAADTVGITTGGTERVRIDSAGLITGTGNSLGAWQTYTPTFTATGWNFGNAVGYAYYQQIGKFVFVKFSLTIGSTTTYGASSINIQMTLPPVTARGVFGPHSGTARLADVSGGIEQAGQVTLNSTTTAVIQHIDGNGRLNVIQTSSPFSWQADDYILGTFMYEAA